MAAKYSAETCRALEQAFASEHIERPLRVDHYDPGLELTYDMTGVCPARQARVRLSVEKFIGGGFAGQVYRVVVLAVDGQTIDGLEIGRRYALKVLVPPSPGKTRFRDALYAIGFQGPFSMQSNPAAIRGGAIWQKLIRRAAAIRFGDEGAVKDIHATFIDTRLGSCGEISEWVEGRQWRFEVDDHLDARRRHLRGRPVPPEELGSPEYLAKRQFMHDFVRLLHEMGAPELARQYEWWTCKSQPNLMKRSETEADPRAGLCALDFRAGLALLPFLPMSPGDIPLIARGLARGSLVQFDRGDLHKLAKFITLNNQRFQDLMPALEELKAVEPQYRDSLPDVTHHGLRLLYDGGLWRTILDKAVDGWEVRNTVDAPTAAALRRSRFKTLAFASISLIACLGVVLGALLLGRTIVHQTVTWPVVAITVALALGGLLAGKFVRRIAGRGDHRRHYSAMLFSLDYLQRSVRAHVAETLIRWHRAGRVDEQRTIALASSPLRFALHAPLAVLPVGLHKLLTSRKFAKDVLRYLLVRPLYLYFKPSAREEWLLGMLAEGKRRHMLTEEDARHIESQIKEPFIQKYLKSLAVHVCLMPVGHLISLGIGVYLAMRFGKSLREGMAIALGILALFQVTPVSPGSILRGLYVLYLVARERNFRDYRVALPLAFFKYIGYLAFPVQMATRYPALARFMAAHWATGAVHVVPVFGEHGALLEHGMFDIFYNKPLTLRRRIAQRSQRRAGQPTRLWHALPIAAAAWLAMTVGDAVHAWSQGQVPTLNTIWYLAALVPLASGWLVARGCGGAKSGTRVVLAGMTGLVAGVAHAFSSVYFQGWTGLLGLPFAQAAPAYETTPAAVGMVLLWHIFLFTLLGVIAAIAEELHVSDRELPEGTGH